LGFGTVTLTQAGANANFTVTLANGNRFVETGSGDGKLFLFNDAIAGSTITTIASSPSTPAGGLSGFTNNAPEMADGTGFFTAWVQCTVDSQCNGATAPNMTSLSFTVTNATLAQLETANAAGNLFAADILCGATQTDCPAGSSGPLTGPVDASVPVPEPTTLLMVGTLLAGLGAAWRRRQKALTV